MPLYQYQCLTCGAQAEKLLRSDIEAPMCCGKYMERRMSVSNINTSPIKSMTVHHNGQEVLKV